MTILLVCIQYIVINSVFQNEKKTDNLGQAKDRAQLTATSALSVVHVALLKEVIVTGPENNP